MTEAWQPKGKGALSPGYLQRPLSSVPFHLPRPCPYLWTAVPTQCQTAAHCPVLPSPKPPLSLKSR